MVQKISWSVRIVIGSDFKRHLTKCLQLTKWWHYRFSFSYEFRHPCCRNVKPTVLRFEHDLTKTSQDIRTTNIIASTYLEHIVTKKLECTEVTVLQHIVKMTVKSQFNYRMWECHNFPKRLPRRCSNVSKKSHQVNWYFKNWYAALFQWVALTMP